MPIEAFGLIFPDPKIHDSQHLWSSLVGGVAGVAVLFAWFVVYKFNKAANEARDNKTQPDADLWSMPWYYYVVAIVFAAMAGSAVACVLSTSIRPR